MSWIARKFFLLIDMVAAVHSCLKYPKTSVDFGYWDIYSITR